MVELNLQNIHIYYDDFHAVKGINLDIENGEILTLLGPSGCGKTTILRAVAGFITPKVGSIILGNKEITNLPPRKRDMGMIFQNYALWPHMTVSENIGFGLKLRKKPKSFILSKVNELLDLVHLPNQGDKYPTQLSGGQQQRVALARALAIEPLVLLCDEPLSNLDYKLRVELRKEIRDVSKTLGVTVVYVTHDQTEALAISDRIAVLNEGEIIQIGTPFQIFHDPHHLFVATFIGENNIFEGSVESINSGTCKVELSSGEKLELVLPYSDSSYLKKKVKLMCRFDPFVLEPKDTKNTLSGIVKHKSFMGTYVQLEVEQENGNVFIINEEENIKKIDELALGVPLSVHIPAESLLMFDAETGERLGIKSSVEDTPVNASKSVS